MNKLALGVMSGTSFDGVDVALFDSTTKSLVDKAFLPYEESIHKLCVDISLVEHYSLAYLARCNYQITQCYIKAIENLLSKQFHDSLCKIGVIGIHGQTIRHEPNAKYPYSCQLGDPSLVACYFDKPVVSDFRRNDITLGGQGAPLAPIFHRFLFSIDNQTAVLNLGGIANISFIDQQGNLRGFDTGPANSLMDQWCQENFKQPFDEAGLIASNGTIQYDVLEKLMKHPFFKLPFPKSADKLDFSMNWLNEQLSGKQYNPQDIQATLAAFTLQSIKQAVNEHLPNCSHLIVCGGGVKNTFLMAQLTKAFDVVHDCNKLGYPADYIEAMMVAWLAQLRLAEIPVNLTSVTGASKPTCLGSVTLP